jgi:hypothetical protein
MAESRIRHAVDTLRFGRRGVATAGRGRCAATAAHDVAINLSLHGRALSLYAANELAETLRDAIAILADPDVRAAYDARDMWQLIDRVATLELGGARNAVRYRTMAVAGAVVIAWLAKHLERVAPASTEALLQPTDDDLVTACANWLAVRTASPVDVNGSSVEARFAGDFRPFVTALLATNR